MIRPNGHARSISTTEYENALFVKHAFPSIIGRTYINRHIDNRFGTFRRGMLNYSLRQTERHPVKVNAYEVELLEGTAVPFQDALRRVGRLPEADLLRTLDRFDMKVESFTARRNGICEMEFSRRIRQDIAKISGVAPTQEIPLEEDQSFGAFTAALYVPESNRLLLESGQNCVKGSAIGEYVSKCSDVTGSGYALRTVISNCADPDVIRGKECRKIFVDINTKKLMPQDRACSQGLLSSLFGASDGLGGDRIKFEISCQRVKPKRNSPGKIGLVSALLMDLVEETYALHTSNPEAVEARFTARDGENLPDEILAFLGLKLVFGEDIPAQTGGRRYPLAQKIRVLYQALEKWRGEF
jgi:hypothetical protein